jgi:hypothetical protein
MDDQRTDREGGGVKTKTRFTLIFAAIGVALVSVAAQVTAVKIEANQIGGTYLATGYTGYLLGEEITIRGHKTSIAVRGTGLIGGIRGTGDSTFQVEEINDKKQVLPIQVEGIESWPDKTAATLRGYEQGYIRFLHLEDTKLPKGSDFVPRQVAFVTFHVTEIIEPKTLQLGNENKSNPTH